MSYTEITKYDSPNYTPNSQVRAVYGMNRTIEGITIHWWGDPNQNPSFEGVVAWLCRANGNSSAHVVATGTSTRAAWIVNAPDAAWHAGSARGNATTIGIECDPRARAGDYAVVAELIADLWIAYKKKLPLYPHKHWMSTQCPGAYNLTRLKQEADGWYAKKTNPVTPAPEVTLKKTTTFSPTKKFRVTTATTLVNIPANTKYSGSKTYAVNEVIEDIAEKLEYSNGYTFYRTKYARDTAKKYYGFGASKLSEIIPEPEKPEWIKNLKDITDTKLTVLPTGGTKVVDLVTMKPVNDTIIPKGTQVDIAKETTVGGKKYYISSWAVDHTASQGIIATDLGVPVVPPTQDKPEWLENLQDITDQDFWTRSATPVLKLEDGSTVRTLPINSKVRITHATSIVGNDLLVLEGQKEGIQTIYLSDKPIENPDKDIESRLSALEKIVKAIVDFLSGIFKNFKV